MTSTTTKARRRCPAAAVACGSLACLLTLPAGVGRAQPSGPAPPPQTAEQFRVLDLAESGGHHVAFTAAARPWLKRCGQEAGFEVDYLTRAALSTPGAQKQIPISPTPQG